MNSWFLLLLLLPLVFTSPLKRETGVQYCGQFETIKSGSYSLFTNHWGESDATSGWQCSVLEHVNGSTATWYTNWGWTGGTGIKSFTNIQLNDGNNRQLSAISTMQSRWHWGLKNTGTETVVADVAYDLFTSYSPGGSNVNEVMLWLANYNAGPISYEYGSDGEAVPIATNLTIAGYEWNMYCGSNGYNEVYSFLPAQGDITTFSGDIYGFFTHLIDAGYINSSEYLTTAQAGTEATSGSALFVTAKYSLTIT
ncbi:glycoside hydrolase family 12 protein [Butyriboletus roseoflavus]|nr:glycoside hydrolase family 12 protein [Butyriboletus roseoflavus]